MRIVAADELSVTLDKFGNEGDIPAQAVKLRYHEDRSDFLAVLQGGKELGTVFVPAAAFDFCVLSEKGSVSGDVARNGFPLCLHAETGDALFLQRDTQV